MGVERSSRRGGPLVCCLVLAVAASGCLLDAGVRTRTKTLAPIRGPIEVSGQQHAATVKMGDGNTIDVAIQTSGVCTRSITTRSAVVTTPQKSYFIGSIFGFVYGGIGVLAGGVLYLIPSDEDGLSTRQQAGKYLAIAGITAVVSPIIYKKLKTSSKTRVMTGGTSRETLVCPGNVVALTGELIVRAPWGYEGRAGLVGGRARVSIDWASSKIDPLGPDVETQLAAQWGVWSGDGKYRGTWSPAPADIDKMRYAIGTAVGIEMDAERGGAKPALAIERLEIGDGGVINAGERVQIKLTLKNEGSGPAYRVVARTKSGMTALRNLHFSFGLIQPGQSKSAIAVVDVPRQKRQTREPIIIQIGEYNDNVPRSRTEQVTVRPSMRPAMRLSCHLEGPRKNDTGQPTVDAGKSFGVVCNVENTGGAPAKNVTMTVRMARGTWEASTAAIGPNKSEALRVEATVPKTAQLDERYRVDVSVAETNFGTSESWTTTISAGTPNVCPEKLSDAQYREKRGKLEKLRDEGILTDSEFDKRHAELVDCLQ